MENIRGLALCSLCFVALFSAAYAQPPGGCYLLSSSLPDTKSAINGPVTVSISGNCGPFCSGIDGQFPSSYTTVLSVTAQNPCSEPAEVTVITNSSVPLASLYGAYFARGIRSGRLYLDGTKYDICGIGVDQVEVRLPCIECEFIPPRPNNCNHTDPVNANCQRTGACGIVCNFAVSQLDMYARWPCTKPAICNATINVFSASMLGAANCKYGGLNYVSSSATSSCDVGTVGTTDRRPCP